MRFCLFVTSLQLLMPVFGAYRIVQPPSPKPWEMTAGKELAHYLSLRVGDKALRVAGGDAVTFHVGDTPLAVSNGLASSALKDEEWVVRGVGSDVLLNGGGTRGCLYAVFRFLEDRCGIRWWMDGEEDVPPASDLELPEMDDRGRPHFRYRSICRASKSDFRTCVRNRVNVEGFVSIPPEWGGANDFGPPAMCHTWDRRLPFSRYGAEHPEWYSLIKGRRIGGQRKGQFCTSCAGLPAAYAEKMEESIREGESKAAKAGLPPPAYYDMSMNDNHGFCTCSDCEAATLKYGHSGRQLLFENQVAGLLRARHPDLLFSVFAYYHSEPPPIGAIRADDNVIVRLCNTRANLAAPVSDPANRFFRESLAGWRTHASNLFVWDYMITYNDFTRGFPFPSERHYAEKFRLYADNGVSGVLLEHEKPDCADMYALKFYLEAKALEDPYRDLAAVKEDFMRRYYGAAGAYVERARFELERLCRTRGGCVTWTPLPSAYNWITDRNLTAFGRLFDMAEGAVSGNAVLVARVREARAGFDRLGRMRAAVAFHPEPETGVSDVPFLDLAPCEETYSLAESRHVRKKDRLLSFVDDPASSRGRAVRILRKRPEYGFPFVFGAYDVAGKRTVASTTVDAPAGDGYQWYDLPDFEVPEGSHYFYFTRNWTLQVAAGTPRLKGRVRLRAHIKFDEDAIYVNRVIVQLTEGVWK